MLWLKQLFVFCFLSVLGVVIIFVTTTPLDRHLKCDQTNLAEWEICWETVINDLDGNVLWVDARSEREFKNKHLNGALWIAETNSDERLSDPEIMQSIGIAGMNKKKVVVYCATNSCGSSKYVAERIRSTGFHDEVYILFGGWKAIKTKELR